jgi:hypothetical protein
MPLLGHTPDRVSNYGHLGYHIITYDESQDDFGLGGGLVDDTDMGRGKLWRDADINNAALPGVKVIDGGVYTSNELGADDTSQIGAPFYLESGNSISGLFRGDQMTFISPDSASSSHTALSAFPQTLSEDYQVILYISKKGKNGGRWAKHVRPTLWASDGDLS